MRVIRFVLVSLLSSSLVFTPIAYAAELALPSGDLVAPVIKHEPVKGEISPGQMVSVNAVVTDNVGVKDVILFYRESDNGEFKRKKMKRDLDSDTYATELPIASSNLEYYIQAADLAGNTLLFGHSFSPLMITVAPGAAVGADSKVVAAAKPADGGEKKGVNKWVWAGLGVLAVGAIAGGGGGGGGGSPTTDTNVGTGSLTISGQLP